MKDMKNKYREAFDQFKDAKTEADYLSKVVDRCREKLLLEFESWYQDSYDHSHTRAEVNLEHRQNG